MDTYLRGVINVMTFPEYDPDEEIALPRGLPYGVKDKCVGVLFVWCFDTE